MNKEIRDQWIAALRNGKYDQVSGTLRYMAPNDQVSYCCLGVLCELHSHAVGGSWGPETNGPNKYTTDNGNESAGYPPLAVMEWAELYDDLEMDDRPVGRYLTHQNDHGKSFAEIADIIEEHL